MLDLARSIIVGCWLIFVVFWIVSAFSVKRTIERGGGGWERLALLATGAGAWVLFRRGEVGGFLDLTLWPRTAVVAAVAVLVTVSGLAFTLWARVTLGRNWSGSVVFKQDHELIERGPYRLVRHPIYTGLLLMALGTSIAQRRVSGFAMTAILLTGLWLKSRREERLMTAHFPEAYPRYRERVRALIPFIF